MAEWNALLPQPPAGGGGNLLSDPTKVMGLIGQINQNALFNQIYKAREGVGEAYKGAVGPDGTIDEPALRRGAANAGFLAPETMTAVQAQEGQRIANATNAFGLAVSQNKVVTDAIGTLADKPNLKIGDVYGLVGTLARHTNIPAPILNGWANTLPKDGTPLREALTAVRNLAIGSAPTASRVEGSPTGEGAATTITAGQANYQGAGVVPTDPNAPMVPTPVRTVPVQQGIVKALAPGEAGALEASAKGSTNLQSTAVTSPQYHADLDMLKRDSKILGKIGGPTVDWEKKANQIATRLKEGFGITMTPDQLGAAESFTKVAEQISARQLAVMSDAGLHNAQAANPSLQMSQLGREGVIDMLKGNQDAIDTVRRDWNKAVKAGAKPGSYNQFASEFADSADVRVFQFNRLSQEAKQKFINTLDPAEIPVFEDKLRTAIKNGWIKAPAKNAQ